LHVRMSQQGRSPERGLTRPRIQNLIVNPRGPHRPSRRAPGAAKLESFFRRLSCQRQAPSTPPSDYRATKPTSSTLSLGHIVSAHSLSVGTARQGWLLSAVVDLANAIIALRGYELSARWEEFLGNRGPARTRVQHPQICRTPRNDSVVELVWPVD